MFSTLTYPNQLPPSDNSGTSTRFINTAPESPAVYGLYHARFRACPVLADGRGLYCFLILGNSFSIVFENRSHPALLPRGERGYIGKSMVKKTELTEQVIQKFSSRCPYCDQPVSYDQFDLKIGENEIQCPSCKKIYIKMVAAPFIGWGHKSRLGKVGMPR